VGLPDATRPITRDSSSIPTAVEEGGGVNFGGTARRKTKNKFN
jgi:hypothetical protein